MNGWSIFWDLAQAGMTAISVVIWAWVRQARAEVARRLLVAENSAAANSAALAQFKLDVAERYASIAYIRDVEKRITEHLLRIEANLDRFVEARRDGHGAE